MTSEGDCTKTNEFLRRRKLRLQQVREQSKDIAKKIRQRAKVEKLRQVVELDSKKQKEYLRRQEQLVKQLEEYYAKGIDKLGDSHKKASDHLLQDEQNDKVDPSKQRGKEAAAELRKKRQQILDQQKKLLDRKLQARESANELSREKSSAVVNKLQQKPVDKGTEGAQSKADINCDKNGNTKQCDDKGRDMATQWNIDEMPNEWEPNIPTLALPKDDNSVKETNNNNVDSKSDKSKRLDLFALSEEMPSSLRGGLTNQEERERLPVRPSLTLVSEYLQNRGLRLREPDTAPSSKKMEDLQSLKHTILRTRTSKEVSANSNVDKTGKSGQNSAVSKRNSVTMYNHSTRYSKDVPCNDERLVVRDIPPDDDAYSQAMRESTTSQSVEKDHKIQEIRSKVAMTKQSVEKEYQDTISFLNALPKDRGNKPIRTAFMDEQRQQMLKDSRQQKLQQEYRKIEKECAKHNCRSKPCRKSRTPPKEHGDVFESTDIQYSWMPVPESDSNLAIHTIPTTLKEGKPGNTVKFSKVDSYHEYRSRHKHTPPTKDTAPERPRRHVEAVVIQNTSESESPSDSSSSTENIRIKKRGKNTEKSPDSERIIIYKIADSKANKRKRNSKLIKDIAKSLTLIEKQKESQETDSVDQSQRNSTKRTNSSTDNRVSFEQLNEGVYKTVNEKGDNIASMYFREGEGEKNATPMEEPSHHRGSSNCDLRSNGESHQQTETSRPCECGENPLSANQRSVNTCPTVSKCGCKVKPKENVRVAQPSATTSTSSFRTATNDKGNSALSDGGFIKLIDEGGQEAGKFYIGASGFLKDDAYEVVIQLRKKGDDREVSEKSESNVIVRTDQERLPVGNNLTPSTAKSQLASMTKTEVAPTEKEQPITDKVQVSSVEAASTQNVSEEYHESSRNDIKLVPSVLSTVSDQTEKPLESKNPGTSFDIHFVSQVQKNSQQTMAKGDDSVRLIENAIINDKKQVSEKGVCTVLQDQDTYTVTPNIPKSEPTPRPATSTYTQTSMSSPNNRPVLFHMSSSTSTAYMSPPEMILPKFLRNNYLLSDQDINDPKNYSDLEADLTVENLYTDEYKCKCKKCTHVKKVSSCKKVHSTHQCRKGSLSPHDAKTPPNSVRHGRPDIEYICETKNKCRTADPLLVHKKSNCTCRKCASPGEEDSDRRRSRSIAASKHSSRNLAMRATTSAASSKRECQPKSKGGKSNLKPVIKNYVDKLLVLNKESLKAVQVIDQDCSAVPTPGSSIIDVPNNVDKSKPNLENKLSLQQIQSMLRQKLIDDTEKSILHRQDSDYDKDSEQDSEVCLKRQSNKHIKNTKFPRKKSVHKVKSLNISKTWSRAKKSCEVKKSQDKSETSSFALRRECAKNITVPSRNKIRSKSSPTPRFGQNPKAMEKRANSDLTSGKRSNLPGAKPIRLEGRNSDRRFSETSNRMTTTSNSPDSERHPSSTKRNSVDIPASISTQTSTNFDSETNFMKLAEDKLQNMEKIADLTEKCTQRLSNLAKVLEEVRKNKSLAYSQMSSASDSTSDSDKKSERNMSKGQIPTRDTGDDINNKSQLNSSQSTKKNLMKESDSSLDSGGYVPFLSDIPKPLAFKNLNIELDANSSTSSSKKTDSPSPICEDFDNAIKNRGKPPPALSRIHLKHVREYVVPHELSTVVEVDSPMSVKLKSSRNDTKEEESSDRNHVKKDAGTNLPEEDGTGDSNKNPNLPSSIVNISNGQHKLSRTDTSNNKIQAIDMKQFNEIVLKPFFSIQEYAKQCNIGALEDYSNIDDIIKDDHINDELSSLHSEASLPDVISELLKRNIISEPFKFDTGSNANSTTLSSESTISVLALSKARQARNKHSVMFQNKENVGDSSDTLSISSNPDLEHAFKKLGLGWASSTLKKTKERLALSSSSNTSSSSLSQFKVKSFSQDIPALVTDTVSSVLLSKKIHQPIVDDNSKNAEQQTSLSNSMTVKEFLTNELSKKITFNNKSRNDTEEEFVSLFETKMPEAMKHCSGIIREENSIDNSTRSGNNRARTSTPVQLFKSMTYHSSSSSNISNGLFSNADDLSSVKVTSNSMKHSTSDKDDLIIPDFSLRLKRGSSDCSKSD